MGIMKKEIIKISTLISSDVRSRSNAEIIRSAINGISDKIILDFSGVSFVSRSFTDELCSIVEHCKNITIDMINMSEIVKTMIEAVEKGRKNRRIRTKDDSEIKEFDDIKSLSKFHSNSGANPAITMKFPHKFFQKYRAYKDKILLLCL